MKASHSLVKLIFECSVRKNANVNSASFIFKLLRYVKAITSRVLRRGGGCEAPGDTGSTATDSNPFSLTYLYEINTIDDNIMYEMKFFYNCNNLFRIEIFFL